MGWFCQHKKEKKSRRKRWKGRRNCRWLLCNAFPQSFSQFLSYWVPSPILPPVHFPLLISVDQFLFVCFFPIFSHESRDLYKRAKICFFCFQHLLSVSVLTAWFLNSANQFASHCNCKCRWREGKRNSIFSFFLLLLNILHTHTKVCLIKYKCLN